MANDPKKNGITDSKIDAIKEIIFGQNIKEYEASFDSLTQEINAFKASSQAELNQLKADFGQQIKSLREEQQTILAELKKNFAADIEQLNQQKVTKENLANLLHKLADKLV